MRINEIRAILQSGVPFVVLTATSTESIKQDILYNLEMSECQIVYASPNRSNIYFAVNKKADDFVDLDFVVEALRTEKKCIARQRLCALLCTPTSTAHLGMNIHTILMILRRRIKAVAIDCMACITPTHLRVTKTKYSRA